MDIDNIKIPKQIVNILLENSIETDPVQYIYLYNKEERYKKFFKTTNVVEKIKKEIDDIFNRVLKNNSKVKAPIKINLISPNYFNKISVKKSKDKLNDDTVYKINIYIPDNEVILDILLKYIKNMFVVMNIYKLVFDIRTDNKKYYYIKKIEKPINKCVYDPYFVNNSEYETLQLCWNFWNRTDEYYTNILYLTQDRYTRYLQDLDFTDFIGTKNLITKFLYGNLDNEEKFWYMKAIDYSFLKNNKAKIKF